MKYLYITPLLLLLSFYGVTKHNLLGLNCEYAETCLDISTSETLTTAPTDTTCNMIRPVFINGCLDNASPSVEISACGADVLPTVWMCIETDTHAVRLITAIDIKGSWTPFWSIWYGACGNLTQLTAVDTSVNPVLCGMGVNTYNIALPVDPVTDTLITKFYIAISARGMVDNPDFLLSAYTLGDCEVCNGDISNCEPLAEIEVVDRENDFLSLDPDGDGLAGPFCPGEKITIRVDYFHSSIMSDDWIIGLVPSFGSGWDLEASDIPNQGIGGNWEWIAQDGGACAPKLTTDSPVLCTYTDGDGNLQLLNLLCESSFQCQSSVPLQAGAAIPSGWFWLSDSPNCSNDCAPQNNYGWPGTQHQMTFEIDLVVKQSSSEGECNSDNDLSFSFQPFTDGFLGCRENPTDACKIVGKQFGPKWKIECSAGPSVVTDLITGLCTGEEADIAVSIAGGLNGSIEIIVAGNTSPNITGQNDFNFTNSGTINDVLVNNGTTVDTARYLAYVTVGGSNCNSFPVMISVPVSPQITITPLDLQVCAPFQLNLNTNDFISGGAIPYAEINWFWNGSEFITSGNILNNYTLTESGFILLQITDASGCVTESEIPITVFQAINPIINLNASSGCNADNQNITATVGFTQGGPAAAYNWSVRNQFGQPVGIGTSLGSSYQINTSGVQAGVYTISVIVDNNIGCSSLPVSESFTIFSAPNGTVVQQSDLPCGELGQVCIVFYAPNGSDIYGNGPDNNNDGIPDVYDVNFDGVPEFLEIVWQTPIATLTNNNLCIDASVEGSYSASIVVSGNCVGTIDAAIVSGGNSTPPNIINPGPICQGSVVELSVSPPDFTSYTWSDSNGNILGGNFPTLAVEPTVSSTYSVNVVDANGCESIAFSTVTVNSLPVISFSGSTTICPGEETVIDAGGDPTNSTYLWTNNAGETIAGNGSNVTIDAPGEYAVSVSNQFGCSSFATINILVSNEIELSIAGQNICDNGTSTLDAGSGFDSYSWTNSSGDIIGNNSTVVVSMADTYTVTVSVGGCSGSGQYSVIIVNSPQTNIAEQLNVCNNLDSSPTSVDLIAVSLYSDPGTWSSLDGIDITELSNVSFVDIPLDCYRFVYTTNNAFAPCAERSDTLSVCVVDCACPDLEITNTTLCNDITDYDIDLQLSPITAPGIWSFVDGPETISITNNSDISTQDIAAGDYRFLYTLNPIPDNCPFEDTLTIAIVSKAFAELMEPSPICNSQSATGTTILDLSTLLVFGSGTWIDPQITGLDFSDIGNLDFTGVAEGIYDLSFVTDDAMAPCSNETFSIELQVIDCGCPTLALLPGPMLCSDDAIFDLSTLVGSSAPGTWSEGTGNPSSANLDISTINLEGADSGIYTFNYTLDNPVVGCDDEDEISITLQEAIILTSMDGEVCNENNENGSSIIDLTTLVSDPTGIWTDQNGSIVTNPSAVDFGGEIVGSTFGFVFTSASAQAPCPNETVMITIRVKDCNCDDPELVSNTRICNTEGSSIDLQQDIFQSGPTGSWSIMTQPIGAALSLQDDNIFNSENAIAGDYIVLYTVESPQENCDSEFPVVITVVADMTAALLTSATVCTTENGPEPIVFDLTSVIVSGISNGTWMDQEGNEITDPTTLSFLGSDPGTYDYSYVIQNDLPCEDKTYNFSITAMACDCIIDINDENIETETGIVETIDLLLGDQFPTDFELNIMSISNQSLIEIIQLQDGILQFELLQSFSGELLIEYELCSADCAACESATLFISNISEDEIMPTSFINANSSETNLLKFTKGDMIEGSELWIYNRWGDEIFHAENYENNWDGEGYPAGTYYYVLEVNGEVMKQTLTLFK